MKKIITLIVLLLFKIVVSQTKIDTLYFGNTKIIESIITTANNNKYVVTYNNQGFPASKIYYVNNLLDGLCQTYDYAGNLMSDTEYANGLKNGQSVQYSKGKIITQKAYYKNDTVQGPFIKYMGNRKIQTLETFLNGNKKGPFEYRFNSGLLSAKGMYDTVHYISAPRRDCGIGDKRNHGGLNIKSILVGLYQTWYESGSKQKEEHYDKGLLNGVQKAWYENGNLKSVFNYKKNNLNGEQIEYHENGNVYKKYTSLSTYDTITKQFKNNYEGLYAEYNAEKTPIKIVHYKNNIPHGTWQTFTNGKPTLSCEYSNGLLINERKTFFTNTIQLNTYCNYKLIKCSTADTSYIDGESKTYHQNGIVNSVSIYKDGIQIKQTMYNADAKISSNTQLLGDLAYTYHYFNNGNTEHEYTAFYNPKKNILNQDYKATKIYFENGKIKQLFYNDYTNTKLTQHYNDSGLVIFNKIHLTEKIGIETDYYNSGALKSEGLYMNLNTKLNGFEYIEWYENGNPKSIEVTNVYKIIWLSNGFLYKAIAYKDNNPNYPTPMVIDLKETTNLYEIIKNTPQKILDRNKKNGVLKSYYGTNKPKIEATFYEGNLDNKLIFYFYNGSPMAEFKIDKGVLNGSYKLYTEQCKPLLIGNYCNGLECGKRTDFTSNGDTISDVEYYQPLKPNTYNVHYNHKKEFYYKGNYGIQKPHLQNWFNYNASNKQHGLQTNYYANGNLMCSKTMSNGNDIGIIKNYYESGNLKENYTLDTLGNKQGNYTYYYPNKKITSTSYYTNNLQHGVYVYYWTNGAKRIEGNYHLGKKIGAWQYYDSLGVSAKTENFENDKKTINPNTNYCNCKTIESKIGFAPMITDLMDIKRADIWQFAHHESITPYLKGLFYMNYQTSSSQNNNYRFTSCDIISFKELVTHLPNKNGIEFVLNPCYKYQAYSRIPLTCHAVTNDPDKTQLQISPEALSFKFDTILLKPIDASIKQTEAFFKGYIDYTKTDMTLNSAAYISFVPSKITATKAILILSNFTPIINTISTGVHYLQENLALKNNLFKKTSDKYYYTNFYGIANGKGFIKSSIDTSLAISSVLINKNTITGMIELNVEKNSISKYLFANALLTELEILEKLKALFNNSVQLTSKTEGGLLQIAFLIKN